MTETPYIDISPTLRILGTAHVSTASVEAVREQISTYQPERVAVELCDSRYQALTSDRRLDKEGLLKVVKEGKAPLVLLQSLLAAEQRKMGLDEGQQPGAELLAAVQEAEAAELEVALIDRDIQTTLRRAWKKMRFREKVRILWSLLGEDEDEDAPEVSELLENQDLLTSLMEELRTFSPGAGLVLIDERDSYLAGKLALLHDGKKKTLAVVGAGHLKGIEKHLAQQSMPDQASLDNLNQLPVRGRISKSIPWLIPLFVMTLIGYSLATGSKDSLIEMFTVWTAANAVFAALGCALARGHPLAILTAAAASPITSLNPTLAAGWFAGYVQLKIKEPTAEDLQQFLKLESLGSFWSNKAGRVLMVTSLSNLGSMAGAWFAATGLVGSLI
ncbi:MAG: TraB/GumN family protein [Euryarchaeota archaeon]|jgi:pheromone shutdown-related protein TraB|nr:TraB/GumN family protein [Euryarchaeota archaeon]MBT5026608.1 TraB/GumN family protein [Euryarchaeota archaeon]MBT6254877.1 TraB/GumN family protein [Euryarchaeota archaeon]MBT6527307.1 TraB/GumN family protein [Euryarchaeota archaeon]MBT7960535.1 TraB/GumN family protein [Euryarchaeota archaeon]